MKQPWAFILSSSWWRMMREVRGKPVLSGRTDTGMSAPSWISSLIHNVAGHNQNKGRVDRRSRLLTIGDRLGPARVRGRVIVHQIQVDSSHHGVQFGHVLAVGGEELVRDRLSADQIVTGEGKTMTFYLQETGDLKLNQEVLVTHRQNCRKAAFRSLVLSS